METPSTNVASLARGDTYQGASPLTEVADRLHAALRIGDPDLVRQACAKFDALGPAEVDEWLCDYVKFAQQAATHLTDLHHATENGHPMLAHAAYHKLLALGIPPGPAISRERLARLLGLAKRYLEFRAAVEATPSDPARIALLGKELEIGDVSPLSPTERLMVAVAVRQTGALERIRQAINKNDDDRIAAAYQPALGEAYASLTWRERSRIALALLHVHNKSPEGTPGHAAAIIWP